MEIYIEKGDIDVIFKYMRNCYIERELNLFCVIREKN